MLVGSSHVYHASDERGTSRAGQGCRTHLGESAVVPDVAMVGEAVADETQATLFDVLLDGVEGLLLGYFHLGVGPAGNLDDHVEDAIAPVREKWDVVPGRNDLTVSFDVNSVI